MKTWPQQMILRKYSKRGYALRIENRYFFFIIPKVIQVFFFLAKIEPIFYLIIQKQDLLLLIKIYSFYL